MPKAKDTEYRDRTATAERTEYQDRTATAEKTEYQDRTATAEKTEYQDRTATAEKTEYQDRTDVAEKAEFADEKTEHKTQYPAENRYNSYLAANQHMVKFADDLRGINEQAALSFDRRKNPAEYDLKEKQEMLEAVTEAFNAANWNSAIERRLAADDIAQNLYHPMYPRLEIADAAVQHKLPDEFIQELKQEKIEYFENKPDEAGVEALQITVKDIETAERMVEQSGGRFHVVSTRNLDHYRDQFADALYSSDRHEGAAGLMESSLDDAIRLYNGDVSHVRRWDETLEERANFWEQESEREGESDQQQAEGQLEPTDRESAAFRNLQSMDEYTLDHSIRDMLNEKLSRRGRRVPGAQARSDGPPMSESSPPGLPEGQTIKKEPAMKLEMEMIPRPLWAINPYRLMPESKWDQVCRQAYADCGHQCGICGDKGKLECHTRWEYDDANLAQRLPGFHGAMSPMPRNQTPKLTPR